MMTQIEGEKVVINKPQQEVHLFLSDFNNYFALMPDQVENWTATKDECRFNIKGMPALGMKITEKKSFSEIKISQNGSVPFDFNLLCLTGQAAENPESCNLQLILSASLNPFLKMVAEKPLKNFLNMLTTNCFKHLSPS